MKYPPKLVDAVGYKQSNEKQPEPLVPDFKPAPEFPIKALSKTLGQAARAIAEAVQVPDAMAGQSVLAVASLVAQSFYNVHIDGRKIPLSLFCLTMAESGDRKSSTDKVALKPILMWQRNEMGLHAKDVKQYEIQNQSYKTLEKIILQSRKKSQEEISRELSNLIEPIKPSQPKLITTEPTFEGLQKGFLDGSPFQGLFNDEGALFFGGHSMNPDNLAKTAAGMSKFWDGATIERTRASKDENLYLDNRRLTTHLMFQPVIGKKVMTDPVLLGQGFLARFLISNPQSIAGTRMYNSINLDKNNAVDEYNKLITDLLNRAKSLDDEGGLILEDLNLTQEAKEIWVEAYNIIETQLSKEGELAHVKPTASKIGENILRISGIFATIESTQEINKEQMQRAIDLGNYYMKSFLWILDDDKKNILKEQAYTLYEWVSKKITLNESITVRSIVQAAPRITGSRNNSSHARVLMKLLCRHGYMVVVECNSNREPSSWNIKIVKKKEDSNV